MTSSPPATGHSPLSSNGFINAGQFEKLAQSLAKNGYGQYMLRLLNEGVPR
jgi:dTDP-glucose pyrophosphorylase